MLVKLKNALKELNSYIYKSEACYSTYGIFENDISLSEYMKYKCNNDIKIDNIVQKLDNLIEIEHLYTNKKGIDVIIHNTIKFIGIHNILIKHFNKGYSSGFNSKKALEEYYSETQQYLKTYISHIEANITCTKNDKSFLYYTFNWSKSAKKYLN